MVHFPDSLPGLRCSFLQLLPTAGSLQNRPLSWRGVLWPKLHFFPEAAHIQWLVCEEGGAKAQSPSPMPGHLWRALWLRSSLWDLLRPLLWLRRSPASPSAQSCLLSQRYCSQELFSVNLLHADVSESVSQGTWPETQRKIESPSQGTHWHVGGAGTAFLYPTPHLQTLVSLCGPPEGRQT